MSITASEARKIQREKSKRFQEMVVYIDTQIRHKINYTEDTQASVSCHKDLIEAIKSYYSSREYIVMSSQINPNFYTITVSW